MWRTVFMQNKSCLCKRGDQPCQVTLLAGPTSLHSFSPYKHFGSPSWVNSVKDRQSEHALMLFQTTGACVSIFSSGKGVNVFFCFFFFCKNHINIFIVRYKKFCRVFYQLCRFVLMGNYIFFRYQGIKQSQLPCVILKQRQQHQQT